MSFASRELLRQTVERVTALEKTVSALKAKVEELSANRPKITVRSNRAIPATAGDLRI